MQYQQTQQLHVERLLSVFEQVFTKPISNNQALTQKDME